MSRIETLSISGDWSEILPGVRVRLQDAPNEEDMQEYYDPHGIVILQVEVAEPEMNDWLAPDGSDNLHGHGESETRGESASRGESEVSHGEA